MTRPDWHDDAACKGHPVAWWFPDQGETAHRAIAICHTCPVIDHCRREHGGEEHGIWHGEIKQWRRPRRADHVSNPLKALVALTDHGGWMTAIAVQTASGIPEGSLYSALCRLRARSLIEHDDTRGLWRVVVKESAEVGL
jgi:hypothetical protein